MIRTLATKIIKQRIYKRLKKTINFLFKTVTKGYIHSSKTVNFCLK